MTSQDNTTPHKAAEYDTVVRQTIPFYDLYHDETIDLMKTLQPDVKVWLDTGCGTGYLVEKALPVFPEAYFILADPSEAMLRQAQKRLDHVPRGRYEMLDPVGTESLPDHPGRRPQVITALQCHHYLDPAGRRRATVRCFSLLEPGGVYITLENIHPISSRGVRIGLDRWKRFQRNQGRSFRTVEDHGRRFNKGYFPVTVADHLQLLEETGFRFFEVFYYLHMQAGFYAVK